MASRQFSQLTACTPGAILGGEIVIRQFRAEDGEQVHTLLVEGLVYGASSPRNTALRKKLYHPVSLVTASALAIGLKICAGSDDGRLQLLEAAACLCAGATVVAIYNTTTQFFLRLCTLARSTDMANIPAAYGTPRPGVRCGGFWVAALASADGKSSEVVGYIALKYEPPASGTLRRMFVAVRHRRRGIGGMLLAAAIAHARQIGVKELALETSEYQPAAVRLYERHGFVLVGTRMMYLGRGLFLRMKMLRFSREVGV